MKDDATHEKRDLWLMLTATMMLVGGMFLGMPKSNELKRRGIKALLGAACLVLMLVLSCTTANEYGSYDHGGVALWFLMFTGFGLLTQGLYD